MKKYCKVVPRTSMFFYYFRLAIEQGADVVECDVCVTKDLHLVCRHESLLSKLTDVMTKPNLRDKNTTYYIEDIDKNVTGVFTVDLTLEEVKTLRVKQRYGFRDPSHDFMYQIPTLQEYINVAKNANRQVGIYPEVKDPLWANSLDITKNANTTIEDLVLAVLHENGYKSNTDPCFVQTFSIESIQYMSTRTSLPLVFLMGSNLTDITDIQLQQLSSVCYGIGPSKSLIFPYNSTSKHLDMPTDLVQRAHQYKLKVHPYTFRNEDRYLAWNYTQDPYQEYEGFSELGIDGYFTDFPGSLNTYLSRQSCPPNQGNFSFATTALVGLCVAVITLKCIL